MKQKINKVCDLSSISVLPPHSSLNLKFGDDVKRISKARPTGRESSVFSKSQAYQLRSQQSQQSFSQGVSSQHGMFSQLSQNSLDETLSNDQRFGSQERESSTRKNSCLPPINYTRDESQMQLSGPSTSLTRNWNSAAPDHRSGLVSEQLEHRIGMIETSLSRFGIILDSVQSDIMQANKGTKEVLLEIEHIRQKLLVTDNSQQLMNKIQEDIKASLAEGLKTISDQVGTNAYRESLQEISSLLSALPERVEAFILKSQNELLKTFTNEIQTMACSLKVPTQKNPSPSVLPPKAINYRAPAQEIPPCKSPVLRPKVRQATMAPKIELGTWNSVKRERVTFADRDSNKGQKQKVISPIELQRECRVINIIESDEDIDGGFSCLLKEKETGNYSIEEAKEETERILRKARRRKRKHSNRGGRGSNATFAIEWRGILDK